MSNKIFNDMEWTTFTNWEQLLEPRRDSRVCSSDIDVLLAVIFSISVNELNCDRREFAKVFNEKNREFLLLKKAIYQKYDWCDGDKGAFVGLKQLLRVPAGIKIFKDK